MKNVFIIFGILFAVIFTGCLEQQPITGPSKPYIFGIDVQPAFAHFGEDVRVGYFIYNPGETTFYGTVELRYTEGCISTYPQEVEVEVGAKLQKPFSLDFRVQENDRYRDMTECVGIQPIVMVLSDKGVIMDTKTIQLNIVE